MNFIEQVGLVCAVILPFFNIPLIARIIKRKSSADISMVWAIGVWACIVLMAPSGFASKDIVWKTFNIMNLILFSAVLVTTLRYRENNNAGTH